MAPVGEGGEFVLGVLGVVDDQVRAVAEFEHVLGHRPPVERCLVVGHVGERAAVGLDPEAERVADVGHRSRGHLDRSDPDTRVVEIVETVSPRKSAMWMGKNGGCTIASKVSFNVEPAWEGP